jgi:hypothetical protein
MPRENKVSVQVMGARRRIELPESLAFYVESIYEWRKQERSVIALRRGFVRVCGPNNLDADGQPARTHKITIVHDPRPSGTDWRVVKPSSAQIARVLKAADIRRCICAQCAHAFARIITERGLNVQRETERVQAELDRAARMLHLVEIAKANGIALDVHSYEKAQQIIEENGHEDSL